ncbi:Ku protein [Nordella sp. HKS 07]|uniref:non-homologous end joining protein Ku n=1 Tax=Nordella sp. HKS 07 TaxID=2712222 RepID=UPI0013E109C1|nr:Ku protein [Nordella sp. HKS 07]QIG49283.1 Ku protein [Nordella sp. HKS 07]
MAVPGRAYWKGFLRLSLVSIGVAVYNAVDTTSEIKFNQIHKPTGKRINYTKTVKGIGPIDNADIVKAYEVDEDTYVTLEPEELEAIKLESKKTLDLQLFVDANEIDPRYFERPYYIVPVDEHAVEGYLVIRDALKKSGKLGVGQVTMSGREYLVAVGPLDKGLGMHVMRYANEIRSAGQYFSDLPDQKLDAEMVTLAGELIGRKASAFKPEQYKNHYAAKLQELVREKALGHKIVVGKDERPSGSNVVDLMDALRRSVKDDKVAKPAGDVAKGGGQKSSAKKKAGGGRR